MDYLLEVSDLRRFYKLGNGRVLKAVDGVSFGVRPGEIFGLVGESGSGKSTAARCAAGLEAPVSGTSLFDGILVSDRREYRRHKKTICRNLQMVFQDSDSAVNPRMTVEQIVEEPLLIQRICARGERREKAAELLIQAGLDASFLGRYPTELSGGQRQRVCIARALAVSPKLLIADEPIASLDVSIGAQIAALFRTLCRERGMACLMIAHDLELVRSLCDRIGVMYRGKLVELAPAEELSASPRHPYTQALLSAVPVPDPDIPQEFREYRPSERFGEEGCWLESSPGHFVYDCI